METRILSFLIDFESFFPIQNLITDLVSFILEKKTEEEKIIEVVFPEEINLPYVARQFINVVVDGGQRGSFPLFYEITICLNSYFYGFQITNARYKALGVHSSNLCYLPIVTFNKTGSVGEIYSRNCKSADLKILVKVLNV